MPQSEDKNDFKDCADRVTNDLDGPIGPCPDRTELLQFSLDRERLVPHVSRCPACQAILLDVSNDAALFVKPEAERPAEMEEDWLKLRHKVFSAGQSGRALFPDRRDEARQPAGPLRFGFEQKFAALAAILALAVALAFSWGLWLKKQASAELAARKELEQQNHQLQSHLAQMQLSATTPQINFGAYDVYPTTAVVRSPKPPALTIASTPGVPVLLLLNATGQKAYAGYAVEISDAQGRLAWSSENLQRDNAQHNYHLLIPSGFLAPGTYLIRIFGRNEHPREPIADYKIQIVPQRESPTTENAAQK
jgi:hypothetical protein